MIENKVENIYNFVMIVLIFCFPTRNQNDTMKIVSVDCLLTQLHEHYSQVE